MKSKYLAVGFGGAGRKAALGLGDVYREIDTEYGDGSTFKFEMVCKSGQIRIEEFNNKFPAEFCELDASIGNIIDTNSPKQMKELLEGRQVVFVIGLIDELDFKDMMNVIIACRERGISVHCVVGEPIFSQRKEMQMIRIKQVAQLGFLGKLNIVPKERMSGVVIESSRMDIGQASSSCALLEVAMGIVEKTYSNKGLL